jgi:hypothetical protein
MRSEAGDANRRFPGTILEFDRMKNAPYTLKTAIWSICRKSSMSRILLNIGSSLSGAIGVRGGVIIIERHPRP